MRKILQQVVDGDEKALHNLVSLLRTTQRRDKQSEIAKFFNKQTADKCGRLMTDAANGSSLAYKL
ncbi:hypothetical protein ACKZDW_13765 [Ralstonia syzygii subsp. celebesensis]|uniref:hypothetical protein n=1 Tax=Ralstonia syzygii TaxID=28097 RepID=UPI00387E072E